jgi:hypothetical protein
LPPSSTPDPANATASIPPLKSSPDYCPNTNSKVVLRRPVESAGRVTQPTLGSASAQRRTARAQPDLQRQPAGRIDLNPGDVLIADLAPPVRVLNNHTVVADCDAWVEALPPEEPDRQRREPKNNKDRPNPQRRFQPRREQRTRRPRSRMPRGPVRSSATRDIPHLNAAARRGSALPWSNRAISRGSTPT